MTLPLEGYRILDLTRALAGPFCSMILGDLGANVIKAEPVPDGDISRGWGPFVNGESVYYLSANRNKRSIAIDFRHPEGQKLLVAMANKADVLIENFKPGVAEAVGLGYDDLAPTNERLIYASISGFGRGGQYENWPGFDQIAQGMSGLMSLTGSEETGPLRVGIPIADVTAAMWTAIGILAAVVYREKTGRGQRVETSLLASLIGLLGVQGQTYLLSGNVPRPFGNDHPVIYPYGLFEAKDGSLNIAVATDSMWHSLCKEIGLEELADHPDYIDNTARVAHRDALRHHMNERLRTATKAEWIQRFIAADVPAGPIWTLDETFKDVHVLKSGCVETFDHPILGALKQIMNPIRLDARATAGKRLPPPLLGEHTEVVLREFDISDSDSAMLIDRGIAQQFPKSR